MSVYDADYTSFVTDASYLPTADDAATITLPLSSFIGTDDQHDKVGGGGPPYPCRSSVKTNALNFSVILNLN